MGSLTWKRGKATQYTWEPREIKGNLRTSLSVPLTEGLPVPGLDVGDTVGEPQRQRGTIMIRVAFLKVLIFCGLKYTPHFPSFLMGLSSGVYSGKPSLTIQPKVTPPFFELQQHFGLVFYNFSSVHSCDLF